MTRSAGETPSSAPQRVQLRRSPGWRIPSNTVKVDRTTKWGNPFSWREAQVEWGGTDAEARAAAVDLYCRHIVDGAPAPAEDGGHLDLHELRCHFFAHVHELRGKNLACWCPLPEPGEPDHCHAAVLMEIANRPSNGGS